MLVDYLIYNEDEKKYFYSNFFKTSFYKKIPYFILSIIFSFIALIVHYPQKIFSQSKSIFLFKKIFNMSYSFVIYIEKLFIPKDLSIIYPSFDKIVDKNPIYFFSPIILVIFVLIFFLIKNKKIIFGLSFFIITLLPVLNFFPVGLGVPADRYTYVPMVGLFYIFAEGYNILLQRFVKYRMFLYFLIFFIIILLSYISFNRTLVWEDNYRLFRDVLNKNPNEPIVYKIIGQHLVKKEDYYNVIKYFNRAIRLNPRYVDAYNSLGNLYSKIQNYDAAIKNYNMVLHIFPYHAKTYYDRGIVYFNKKFYDKALLDYTRAIELKKDYVEAYVNRGNIYFNLKLYDDAIKDYDKAIKINPNFWQAYQNRAVSYFYKENYKKSY
jgi:tetratricopeptide (TPR) repeat protein